MTRLVLSISKGELEGHELHGFYSLELDALLARLGAISGGWKTAVAGVAAIERDTGAEVLLLELLGVLVKYEKATFSLH